MQTSLQMRQVLLAHLLMMQKYLQKNLDAAKELVRKNLMVKISLWSFFLRNEPRSFAEAISSPDADLWKEAFNSEIDSIMKNHTYYLTDFHKGLRPLGVDGFAK